MKTKPHTHIPGLHPPVWKVEYLRDDYNQCYRVRRADWPQDVFDHLTTEQLEQLKTTTKFLNIIFEELD